ncbi:restriction endonuclease subunit S, partial [Bacteroides acidifaciens]|uniref:restriction endonuclease subunit S n=1 Tax=Bacteroides acidifaciens TaxID=85831 RepID=UPI00259966D1
RSKKSASSDTYPYENVPFEIPESWVWTTLGNIGQWQSGATPSRLCKKYYGGTIPWLKTGDLNDGYIYDIPEYITEKALAETSVKLNPVGSILIAMYGATIGKVGMLTFPATTNQACCACVDYSGIEQKYLFYFLVSHKEEFIMQGGGGAQPNISKEKIVETLIPIPPRPEQVRIVNIIENWFAIIDKIEQEQVDLTCAIKQTKSKILDIAIHGKLVPQDPNDEPAIELLRRINPSFKPCDNAHYKNLPKSWDVIHLGDICQLADGEVISITELPYLDVKSLRNQTYTTKGSGKFIKAGTTLILVDGENSGEVFHATVDGYQGSTMKILNINSNINQMYVLNFIKLYQKALRENKVGSAIPHLNKKMFRELMIPIPPIAEQNRIVKEVDRYNVVIDSIIAEL